MKTAQKLMMVCLAICTASCKSKTNYASDEISTLSEAREYAKHQQSKKISVTEEIVDISDRNHLDPYVGKTVVVRGIVTNTKCPYINGIDMWSLHNFRGKLIEATGILESWTVTEEDIDRMNADPIKFAHRGAGTFYRLKNMTYRQLAKPRDALNSTPIQKSKINR